MTNSPTPLQAAETPEDYADLQCTALLILATDRLIHGGDKTVFDDINGAVKTIKFISQKLEALQAENEAFEHKIITLACKGTDATRFDSVAEMQVASLYKWWKESEQSCDSLKLALEAANQLIGAQANENDKINGELNRALESTRNENTKMRETLILILPMAKGYAFKHQVGNNWQMIEQAEAIALSTPLTNADNSKDVK